MCDVNPEKKARSKAVQAELNSCRDRLRLLEEGKVRRAKVITWSNSLPRLTRMVVLIGQQLTTAILSCQNWMVFQFPDSTPSC